MAMATIRRAEAHDAVAAVELETETFSDKFRRIFGKRIAQGRKALPEPLIFADFESALVRLGKEWCRKEKHAHCPMREWCEDHQAG